MLKTRFVTVLFLLLFLIIFSLSPVQAILPGDANGDGLVDGPDYVIWLNHYNTSVSNGVASGDFDGNGFVDGLDYVLWLNNYNTTNPNPTLTNPPSSR